jgi:hypothetical protein
MISLEEEKVIRMQAAAHQWSPLCSFLEIESID